MLPNPSGQDDLKESITIKNCGRQKVTLKGWVLRDNDRLDSAWPLVGELTAGAEKTFLRNGQGMQLGNSGDSVELVSPQGKVIDRQGYSYAEAGRELQFRLED